MAKTWRIIDLAATAGLTYNFLATDVARPFQHTVINNGDGTVTETMRCRMIDSDANIITSMAKLEAIRAQLDRWSETQFEYNSLWYERYSASETAKRSLITELVFEPEISDTSDSILGKNELIIGLVLTHNDFWEATAATPLVVDAQFDWTHTIPGLTATIAAQSGDLPGNMQTTLQGVTAGVSFKNMWLGIKPTRYGVASFNPVWAISLGTNGTDTADFADATGYFGFVSKCTFATATMQKRMTIDATQTNANFDDLVGSYTVLLRCKLDAAGTTFIQSKAGYVANLVNPPMGESIPFTSTDYKLIEIGKVDIPSQPYKHPSTPLLIPNLWAFELWAERTAGAANLLMDVLILVPSEHSLTIKNADIDNAADRLCYAHTQDDGSQIVINAYAVTPTVIATPEFNFNDWWCPIEGGVLVAMAEGAVSALTDVWYIIIENWARFSHFN